MNSQKKIKIMAYGLILFTLLFASSSVFGQSSQDITEDPMKSNTVYELRIYYPHQGKLEDILKRFREHTTALFEKHGFTNVGYWVTQPDEPASYATRIIGGKEGRQALLYLVSFPNMESRNASWDAFIKDPEWVKVYEESRKNGPLVHEIDQVFLNPTDFSGLK